MALNHILSGKPFKITLTPDNAMSVHRSPPAIDQWWAEHQYGKEYTLWEKPSTNIMFFSVSAEDGVKKSGWYLDSSTFTLHVRIGKGDYEEYKTNEFTIEF